MMTRQVITTAVVACLVASATFASVSSQGEMLIGQALVGVDELGRVAIAVDSIPVDGRADYCFLYTAQERLEGPWSKHLRRAQIFFNDAGALTVLAADRSFLLAVAVDNQIEVAHPEFTEVFTDTGGFELTQLDGGGAGARLDEMSHADVSTWPEGFWYDLHDPESGCIPDSNCQSGGIGASSCSQTCPGSSGGCSVTCNEGSYACCGCLAVIGDPEDPSDDSTFPSCRCQPCSLQ